MKRFNSRCEWLPSDKKNERELLEMGWPYAK